MSPYKLNEKFGQHLAYGDVLITPHAYQRGVRKGVANIAIRESPQNRWVDNLVPYVLSEKYSTNQKATLRRALNELEKQSCFHFVGRTNENDYLFIDKLEGCYSFVGRIGGRQLMSLAAGCLHDFIIWHEVMHAVGFEHEHQRPDRDEYIRVEYRNVHPDKLDNFDKIPSSLVELHHAYDYYSIMFERIMNLGTCHIDSRHYDGTAFGKYDEASHKRLATMIPLRKGIELGDNMKLSMLDLEKLRLLGRCSADKRSFDTKKEPARIVGPQSLTSKHICADLDPNCRQHMEQGMCVDQYRPMMKDMCALTCSMCDDLTPTTVPTTPCADQSRNCPEYVRNGFCENPFYTTAIKATTCAQSCGLCSGVP